MVKYPVNVNCNSHTFYLFIYWLDLMACRILAPLAGMEFVPPAVEPWSPSPWIAREVP